MYKQKWNTSRSCKSLRNLIHKLKMKWVGLCLFAYSSRTDIPICTKFGMLSPWDQKENVWAAGAALEKRIPPRWARVHCAASGVPARLSITKYLILCLDPNTALMELCLWTSVSQTVRRDSLGRRQKTTKKKKTEKEKLKFSVFYY
jgi:hypothetical protein